MWYVLTYWKAWTRCHWETDMHMKETHCPLSAYRRRGLKRSYDPVEMRRLRFNLSSIGRDNIWVMILMKSWLFRTPKCSSVIGETMQWWADTHVILLHTVSMQKSIFNFVWGKMKGVTWGGLCKIIAALSSCDGKQETTTQYHGSITPQGYLHWLPFIFWWTNPNPSLQYNISWFTLDRHGFCPMKAQVAP